MINLFTVRLAWREGRASLRRIGVYMASITLGVGALVAVHSFRTDVERSIREEARSLLGGDIRFGRSSPHSDTLRTMLDSLVSQGATTDEVTTLVSMALAPASETARLLQVRGVGPAFPYYGRVSDAPEGVWDRFRAAGGAVVDPAVLIQMNIEVGDTIRLGVASFEVMGTVEGLPTDVGFQTAIGPRIFVPVERMAETGLLAFGSLARFQIFVRLPDDLDADAIVDERETFFGSQSVRSTTAREQADDLTEGVQILSRFLGLVGLTALLLGGIGVGSAIHVYVKEKLTAVAVLRCLGATQGHVFVAYLVQAGALGVVGAGAGVILGLAAQRLLPVLIRGVLPIQVSPSIDPVAIGVGMGIGVWVSVLFALIPLLAVRDVAPLLALRRDFEPSASRRRGPRFIAVGTLLASLVLLSVWQAPDPRVGLGFAGALAVTLMVLWLAAQLLIRGTRRFFPSWAPYPVRQGVASLFRPQNQTVAVTLALGFGVFLIGTVLQVEPNLQDSLSLDGGGGKPNLLLFDIQRDQVAGVADIVAGFSDVELDLNPIVPGRLSAVNDRRSEELLADTAEGGPRRWALRRLYRNTYRAELSATEEITQGRWWDSEEKDNRLPDDGLPLVSIEFDQAEALRVGVGDRLTWDFQGTEIETRIASVRLVDWGRFEPNFFVVFEPGSLEEVPQTFVSLVRLDSAEGRAILQRDLVRAFPNVSVLDLATIQETIDAILGRVTSTIQFLAGFSVVGGVLVLIGALATSRFQRMRETALLKTLGARRVQILQVLTTEYMSLGALAGFMGVLLGTVSGWLVITRVFELDFQLRWGSALTVWLLVPILTGVIGLLNSRGVLGRPPLATIREISE